MQHGKAHQLRVRRRGRVVSFHPGLGEIRQKQIDVAALLLRDGERRAARGLVPQIFRLHKALRIPIFHPRKPVFRRIEINHLSAQRDSGKLGRLHVIRFAQRDIFLALFHNGLIADAHGFRQRRHGCGHHRRRQQDSSFHIRFLPVLFILCLKLMIHFPLRFSAKRFSPADRPSFCHSQLNGFAGVSAVKQQFHQLCVFQLPARLIFIIKRFSGIGQPDDAVLNRPGFGD